MKVTDALDCPSNFPELNRKFKTCFGTTIYPFLDRTFEAMGMFLFDLVAFDNYFKKFFGNYEEKGKSLEEAIFERFGQDAVDLVKTLICGGYYEKI